MKYYPSFLVFAMLLFSNCNSSNVHENESVSEKEKPNIILMMGDDIGYSDLGSYGSEIETPHLDQLAENGVRFRTFYNLAKCNPTRSSLLTGHYQGDYRSINVAELLKEQGYETIHVGKEHFDSWVPENCYAENVFDHAFYYPIINEFHIPPDSTFQYPFYLNGKQLAINEIRVKEKPFFKTDVVTDYAMSFIDSTLNDEAPFFLYLPYHIAHFPLQAMPEDIAKYRGKYNIGWDTIRKKRYEKMMASGLLTDEYKLSEPTDNINKFRGHPKGNEDIRENIPLYRPWASLTAEEKDRLDLEMAVFAAMIDRMDQNIGRLVDYLKQKGIYENTVIMYLSDNGSCPYDSNTGFDVPPGPANSYRTLSAAWANVGNTPFKYFKQFGHEGGARTHFIVHWPEKIKAGSITDQPGHVVDIFPTLLDLAGATYPVAYGDTTTIPLHGESLLPVFKGNEREEPKFFISGFTDRFRMFRSGKWKIVKANNENWELYDMDSDPTETNNLSSSHPEKLNELIALYNEKKKEVYLE